MGHVTWCKSNPLIGSIKHYYVPLHDNFTQHSPWWFGTNTEAMKLAEERCKQEKKEELHPGTQQPITTSIKPQRARSQHAVGVKREKREWLAVDFNFVSDWLRKWRKFSRPIIECHNAKWNERNLGQHLVLSCKSYSRISRHTCIKLHTRLHSRQWRRTHKLSLSNMNVWSARGNGKNTAILRED